MAIDQTNKALDIADRIVTVADDFLDAVEALEQALNVATDSGINMTAHDDALAASDLKHVDGATLNKSSTAIASIVAAIDLPASGGVGETVRTLFNKLRKNY